MKKLPTLYKKNTQGKIEQWKIEVKRHSDFEVKDEFRVAVTFGELNGKQQSKWYKVNIGKNIGRSNATEAVDQAEKEAQAKWNKKLKAGYVTSIKLAEQNKTDSIIEGGIVPMLAHVYEDHEDSVKFPVMVQPKLDGQRCIVIYKDGKPTLWTRTRKPILSVPHIIEELKEKLAGLGEVVLDGELYHHGLKDDFEKLMSAVRKQKPSKESSQVQLWLYDVVEPSMSFVDRFSFIEGLQYWAGNFVLHVETMKAENLKRLQELDNFFIRRGYEGSMVRSCEGGYEHKRSKHLLKMKTFRDDEYKITDFIAGKDETVIAVLVNEDMVTFKATMEGDKKLNQKYLKNKKKYIGKMLTVKYQTLTGKNKVPRFPIGQRVRGEE